MSKKLLLVGALVVLCATQVFMPALSAATGTLSGEQAQATRIPWSGWWWPLLDTRNPNLFDSGGPLAKYDAYSVNVGWGDPDTQGWEYDSHRTDDPEATWWGHCHAWAAASVMESEPLAAGYDGGVYFTVGDLKGLMTEAYYAPLAEDYGNRYNGRADDDRDDIYPGLFHQTIRYYVSQQHVALVADIDAGEQVWNYPLYRYSMEFTPDSSYADVTHVAARVWYADDGVSPSHAGVSPLIKDYTYWLQTTGSSIVDSGWEGDSVEDHPDFLWVPTGRDSEQTPVDLAVVRSLLTVRPVQGCAEYLPNGDFEDGEFAPWVALGQTELTKDADAYLGGLNDADDILYQTLAIPSQSTTASLTYEWYMATEEEEHPYDYLKVTVRDTAGSILQTLQAIHDGLAQDSWQTSSFDLRAYVGRTIQIHFEATTDEEFITDFWVDNVALNVCTGNVPTPTAPARPTPTPTLGPAPNGCRDALSNGGFETGDFEDWDTANPWSMEPGQPETTDYAAHTGDYSAWLGGYEDADDFLAQRIAIPTNPSRAMLSYWWQMETDEEEHGHDFFYVVLLDAEGKELATLLTRDDGAGAAQWRLESHDLRAYAGRTVQVAFQGTGDEDNITSFFVDDIRLEVCGGALPPPAARLFLPVVMRRH